MKRVREVKEYCSEVCSVFEGKTVTPPRVKKSRSVRARARRSRTPGSGKQKVRAKPVPTLLNHQESRLVSRMRKQSTSEGRGKVEVTERVRGRKKRVLPSSEDGNP